MGNTALEELIMLNDEIANSPALRIEDRILFLDAVFYMPMTNYEELRKKLRSVTSPGNSGAVWDVNNRQELLMASIEITRLIHNFLAAAFTLVGNTRALIEGSYSDSEFSRDHQAEIGRRFAKDPLHNFMQELRNCFLHKYIIFPAISFDASRDEKSGEFTSETSACFDKKVLLFGFEWNVYAKSYLDSMPAYIDLEKIIETYYLRLEDFHVWRKSRLEKTHDIQLKWLDEKRKRARELARDAGLV